MTLAAVGKYKDSSANFTKAIEGAQKLAKIPKSAISILDALGWATPGLLNFSGRWGALDDSVKLLGAVHSLWKVGCNIYANYSGGKPEQMSWTLKCLSIGSIFEGALVLMKNNVFPVKDHLFTYAGRIALFRSAGEGIGSLPHGKFICEKLFAATRLEMLKNYAFLASAVFACRVLWKAKSQGQPQKNNSQNWTKEACKVTGVLTGALLYSGFVDTKVKKVVAFGLLTATSIIGFDIGARNHKQ